MLIADGRDDIGATVSAFCPVSVDPPLVLVSLLAGSYPAEVLGRAEAPAAGFAVVLLAAGQRVLAHSESFEYPIRPGVAADPELTPLARLHPNSFTPAQLGTGLNAKTLLQEAGLL